MVFSEEGCAQEARFNAQERGAMLARVQKWGNSLALRIPKSVAVEAGIGLESEVELSVRDHQILITPARGEYALADLVNRITPENMHGETEWGPPSGEENW